MRIIKNRTGFILPILFLMTVSLFISHGSALADNPQLSNAVFYVYWYDVGKSALDGLEGIKRIENGFHNSKEINTVYYDASIITIEEMEDALKKAGTYIGTATRVDARKEEKK